jgi:hypothetical protein
MSLHTFYQILLTRKFTILNCLILFFHKSSTLLKLIKQSLILEVHNDFFQILHEKWGKILRRSAFSCNPLTLETKLLQHTYCTNCTAYSCPAQLKLQYKKKFHNREHFRRIIILDFTMWTVSFWDVLGPEPPFLHNMRCIFKNWKLNC